MKILITGDIADWNIKNGFDINSFNPEYQNLISNSDLLISNLEGPIIDSDKPEHIIFREGFLSNLFYTFLVKITKSSQPQVFSSRKILELPSLCNKRILTLANNHVKDSGKNGYLNTIQTLEEENIQYIGAEKSKKKSNSRLELEDDYILLNYNIVGKKGKLNLYSSGISSFGASSIDFARLSEEIKDIKSLGKKVILILHAGKELVADTDQWDFTMDTIGSLGADLCVLHHPHLYIETEYEKKNIFILGDFVFNRPGKLDPDRPSALLVVDTETEEIQLKKFRASDVYIY